VQACLAEGLRDYGATMVTKRLLAPTDAMFLWGETPDTKFHVASLTIFSPPPDAGPTYQRDLLHSMRHAPVESPWNLKLSHPKVLAHPLQSWVVDDDFDLDYHVRRSALASPGDERELGILVSRLHSNQIDFSRPPWEMHVIEGLEGGRFAVYIKVHHALVDGYTGAQIFSRSMSTDPDDREHPFFFSDRPRTRHRAAPAESRSLAKQVAGSVTGAANAVAGIAGIGASAVKAVARLEFGKVSDLANPHQAPDTILNAPIGRNRRFATQQYDFDRLRAVARASGGTLNDVVMAICGGGLRAFLLEQGELPSKPLIAFMPVNLREEGDEGGGNKVGALLASLGTDVAEPKQRLEAVIRSTRSAKAQMKGMDQWAALAYSGYLLAPGAGQVLAAMAGLKSNPFPTAFNVTLSNVPGPRQTRYMRGSRVEAYYPVSIPIHGMALNITLFSYADTINFGFVGCRDAVPSLQKLAVHTGEALAALEAAYGVGATSSVERSRDPAPRKVTRKTSKKAPAKKAPAKKAPAKKAPPKKTTAKKTTSAKSRALVTKKTPAKKAPAKKAATKKTAAKKTTAKK